MDGFVCGPRSDFNCNKCQSMYEDLPGNSTRCPVCGAKRGFVRIFNKVSVSKGMVKQAENLVGATYDKYSEIKQGAAQHEQLLKNAHDYVESQGSPASRKSMEEYSNIRKVAMPPNEVMGRISSESKRFSRECNSPMMKKRITIE